MKQFIILAAMIALGVFIAHLIIGGDSSSIQNTLGSFYKTEIEIQRTYP